jgi:ATP-dependent DNA helicase RecG
LLSVSEIADLYLKSTQNSWDAYPYISAQFEDLNLEYIHQFIDKVNQSGRFKLANEPKVALLKLRMLKTNIPTNAAMILFSKENLLHNVHIGRFKTPSKIIADKIINGSLFNVLEDSMQEIISHLKFAFEITGDSTKREEIPEFPLDAIRELLLNALIHRDYQSPTDVQVKIFDNSISFFNPSGLFGNLTVEDLETDNYHASTRNKQLAEAFYLTKDIEKYGSGFIRIRKSIEQYPSMIFSFENSAAGFTAGLSYTIQKTSLSSTQTVGKTMGKTVGKTVGKIIAAIDSNPNITIPEIMNITGLSRRGVEYQLKKIKLTGILKRIGPAKGGHWEIVK